MISYFNVYLKNTAASVILNSQVEQQPHQLIVDCVTKCTIR